jgi:hypothetical protein
MPYQREAEIVLAAWREADKVVASTEPGTNEYEDALADYIRCRDEYQRLIAEAVRHDRPEPPPPPKDLIERSELDA